MGVGGVVGSFGNEILRDCLRVLCKECMSTRVVVLISFDRIGDEDGSWMNRSWING